MAEHRHGQGRGEEDPHDGSAAKRTGRDGIVAAEFADDLHTNRFSEPPDPAVSDDDSREST